MSQCNASNLNDSYLANAKSALDNRIRQWTLTLHPVLAAIAGKTLIFGLLLTPFFLRSQMSSEPSAARCGPPRSRQWPVLVVCALSCAVSAAPAPCTFMQAGQNRPRLRTCRHQRRRRRRGGHHCRGVRRRRHSIAAPHPSVMRATVGAGPPPHPYIVQRHHRPTT